MTVTSRLSKDVATEAKGAAFIIVKLAPGGFKPVYDGDGQLLWASDH